LLLINDTPNAKVILPGKFFEYMAARRPILCIGPRDGDAAEVILETNAGYVSEKDDKESIRKAINELYSRFRTGKNIVDSKGIARFSRESLTGRMAECLSVISGQD
jgi:glycosyltransferase involved in cell wall biosynthesis